MIEIYTDGACRKNDGTSPASWAMAVYYNGEYKGKKKGYFPVGTNNKAELEGVLQALEWCTRHGEADTVIFTDSAYVQNGCTTWVHGWARKGWKTAGGEPVKNIDQWKRIYEILKVIPPTLRVAKVKGHSGVEGNEKADSICNEVLDNLG